MRRSKEAIGALTAVSLAFGILGCKPVPSENLSLSPTTIPASPKKGGDRYRLSIETNEYGGGMVVRYTDERPTITIKDGGVKHIKASNVTCPASQNWEFQSPEYGGSYERQNQAALEKLNCKDLDEFETWTTNQVDLYRSACW